MKMKLMVGDGKEPGQMMAQAAFSWNKLYLT